MFALIPGTARKVPNLKGQKNPRHQRNLQGIRGTSCSPCQEQASKQAAQIPILPYQLPQGYHLLLINTAKSNAQFGRAELGLLQARISDCCFRPLWICGLPPGSLVGFHSLSITILPQGYLSHFLTGAHRLVTSIRHPVCLLT